MNAPRPLPPTDATLEALRAAYAGADRATRRRLTGILPPAEVEFAGLRLWVDPRDNYTERMIWLEGQPPEMESLRALVEMVEGRRALVLDVGANCGAFTVPLAAAAGQGSRILAFEPNPVMIGRLGHNLALNQLGERVRIESCALGAEAGEAILHLKAGNLGQASLRPIAGRARAGGTLVPVRPLADFAALAEGMELSILKIDVEGAEVPVLAPLLKAGGWRPGAILIETRHAEAWEEDLLGLIAAAGYGARLEAEGNTLFVHPDAKL